MAMAAQAARRQALAHAPPSRAAGEYSPGGGAADDEARKQRCKPFAGDVVAQTARLLIADAPAIRCLGPLWRPGRVRIFSAGRAIARGRDERDRGVRFPVANPCKAVVGSGYRVSITYIRI